jgi:iron complex transport system ATP-binding protein
MAEIELRGVSVAYDKENVLHSISMSVPHGAWLGLIGPNGAGKSTLLRAIAGIVPYSGMIRLADAPALALGRRRLARRIAMVPQNPFLPLDMLVVDYVLMGRTPYISYLGTERVEDLQRAHEVIEQLDLIPFAHRALGSLSGGEVQRAVLGRALAQGAGVLLLDEPTNALDVGRQSEVLDLVEDLRRAHGLTVISAMHDLTLAGQFSDRLLLLHEGRVAAEGSAETVLTETTIGARFGARVRVLEHPDGGLVIAPARTGAGHDGGPI